MENRIKDIAIVQSGMYAKTDKYGDVIYLQAKHFDEKGTVKPLLHPDLRMDGKIKNHLLKDGDLLFAAKGAKNFAIIYRDRFGRAVASSTFLVIRVKPNYQKIISPEYLKWFLNRPDCLRFLQSGAKGTGIPSISKVFIEDLKIDIPSMHTQEIILEVHKLREKEKDIKQQIEELKEKEIQYKLKIAAKKD
ncbi:MAG: restriction endonuclease subunit S [Bacteroidetes bacterium]|nr:restriction endonuclease subunit S [Bacteroidota bacterium]